MSAPFVDLRFREALEDFEVEELDAFEPDGEGDHLVLRVRARGLGTLVAARRVARALGVPARAVSFAGRKDVRAVVTQRLAVEHGDPAGLAALADDPDLEVLEWARHRTALRHGESRGNRFTLRLPGVGAEDRDVVTARLSAVAARGLPNAFGEQRYGRGGVTAELGRLLVVGTPLDYLAALCAAAEPRQREAALELARRARDGTSGEKRRATELCRDLDRDLGAVARQLARRRDDPDGLVRALPKPTRALHLSALQARVFDRVLAARVAAGTFDVPLEGDVLLRPGRGPFVLRRATDVGLVAAAAARALEVSGPIPSPRMVRAEGLVDAAERAALAAEGLTLEDLERPAGLAPKGSRRPLRASVTDARLAFVGDDATLTFALPPGAYATTLLAALRGGPEAGHLAVP